MIEHKKISINEIIILDENPRSISNEDMDKLCLDIDSDPNFLFQRPSLINLKDGKYYCYAGAQRIKAQELLGRKEAICFVENNVSKKTQDKRMLQDNLHRGKWDEDKIFALDFEISELEEIGLDVVDLGLNTDVSILDDLKENSFIDSIKDEADTFGFTLQLPKECKDAAESYVKTHTKSPIVEQVLQIIKNA